MERRAWSWVGWLGLVGMIASGCATNRSSTTPATAPEFAVTSSGDAEPAVPPAPTEESTPEVDSAAGSGWSAGDGPSSAHRPGLGTTWGEDRASPVTTASFLRATAEAPFATTTLYYNDRDGVGAMAAATPAYPVATAHPVPQLQVRLLDPELRPLPTLRAGDRDFVVGEAGQRYLLSIQNHTGNRVEVVATVDGLDVLDGQPGSFRKRGYVLGPWATLSIEGFRRSSDAVAAFRFGSVASSYAERRGKGRNVGVIGVAFFAEAGASWPWTPEAVRYRQGADPFPARFAEPPPPW